MYNKTKGCRSDSLICFYLVCISFLSILFYALFQFFLIDLLNEVADLARRHVEGDFWGETFAMVACGAGWQEAD